MQKRREMEPAGHFGHAMAKAMEEQNLDLHDLAAKTDRSYEHMRKLYRNLASPGYVLPIICKVLKLDEGEMEALATKDKLERKFGKKLHTAMGYEPRVAEYISQFSQLVPHLTDGQVKSFLKEMKAAVNENRVQEGITSRTGKR